MPKIGGAMTAAPAGRAPAEKLLVQMRLAQRELDVFAGREPMVPVRMKSKSIQALATARSETHLREPACK
jgi:hypothetical protein